MAKEMLINVSEGEECRIALLENGKLEELYMERTSSTSHVGNIYKGRVTNVEPSIQAAFVDFGLGRNGFLHISDLLPQYFGRKGEDIQEAVGRKLARRDRPPIQRCLRRGDEIVVQIIKEGIGTKGPTLSTYLSIPGRILVMMPGMTKMGVSRKIEDETERRRLRQILDSLKPPEDVGFIIRTAGVGKTKTEIERDFKFLTRLWDQILKVRKNTPAPVELYTEGDLVTRTVRDVYSADIDRIIVDNKDVAQRVREFIKISAPRTRNKIELYEDPIPLFHKFGIEHEIELMHSRHVPLPSGGSLVIDSTEAIVAIDVNSGKFREHADAETTAFKTDLEAADEICRQLKLRDLGGVIICDFIDLRYERHRRELEKRLQENFKKDRAKTKVLRMSQFGIIEMTRQRMRPSLKRSVYFDCPHCKGAGLVKTPESMSLDVMRKLAIAIHDERVVRVEISVNADVAFYLQNRKRAAIAEMETRNKKRVIVRIDPKLGLDEVRFDLYDLREGLVQIDALGVEPSDQAMVARLPVQQRGRHDQRRGDRHGRRLLPRPAEAEFSADDLFDEDLEETLEAGEERADQKRQQAQELGMPVNGDPAAAEGAGQENGAVNGEGGGRRRRRRRRGGRGRRRGHGAGGEHAALDPAGADSSHEAHDEIGPAPEVIVDPADTDPADDQAASDMQLDAAADEAVLNEAVLDEHPSEPAGRAVIQEDAARRNVAQDQAVQEEAVPTEAPEEAPAEAVSAEAAGDESTEETPETAPAQKRRRGRRGGRGRKKATTEAATSSDEADAAPAVEGEAQEAAEADAEPAAEPAIKPAPAAKPAPAVKSASTARSRARSARTTEPKPAAAEAATAKAATAEAAEAEAAEEGKAKPARRTRRATTRKQAASRRVAPAADQADKDKADKSADKATESTDKADEPADKAAKPAAKPAAPAPATSAEAKPAANAPRPVVIPVPTVRTGSTDRHLADEEPDEILAPRPASRPRSYRDLDAIPDDYD